MEEKSEYTSLGVKKTLRRDETDQKILMSRFTTFQTDQGPIFTEGH